MITRKSLKPLVWGSVGIAVGMLLAGCSQGGHGRAEHDRTVTLAIDVPYKPFVYRSPDGQLEGFEIDYGNALCKRAGLKCRWVEQSWDGIIPGLLARKYTAILSSMAITPEREDKVLFSHPYYNTPSLWIVPRGSQLDVTDKHALQGKTVGVQRGTIRDVYITKYYSNIVNIRRYASPDDIAIDLKNGRLDATFEDYAIARNAYDFEQSGSPFQQVGPQVHSPVSIFGRGAAMAFRPGDTDLANRFNKAIDGMNADGSFKKLMYHYFDYDISAMADQGGSQ